MTTPNSPLGKHLRSLASRLTLWMRPKMKDAEEKEVTEGTDVERADVKPQAPKKTIRSPKVASAPVKKQKIQKPVTAHALPPVIVEVEAEVKVEEPDVIEEEVLTPEPEPVVIKTDTTPAGPLLSVFPDNKNIVGQTPLDITLNGKKHSLMVRTDSLFIDAQKYSISAGGGALGSDVELDILECKREGNTLMLRAGAFGKEGTARRNEEEWTETFTALLRGTLCKITTDKGQTFEIAKNNY